MAKFRINRPHETARPYSVIAKEWLELGFSVVPSQKNRLKVSFLNFGNYCPDKQGCFGTVRRDNLGDPNLGPVTTEDIEEWGELFPNANPLLLLHPGGPVNLVVIDADDPAAFSWVEDTFGKTPLICETGRLGGGRHYYYRVCRGEFIPAKNGAIGPRGPDGRGMVDVKSGRQYVVAPGARHKSGAIYKWVDAEWPKSIDWLIENVPELSQAAIDATVYQSASAKLKKSGKPKRVSQATGTDERIPKQGRPSKVRKFHELKAEEQAELKELLEKYRESGATGTMPCLCPFFDHDDESPSAFIMSGGLGLHCTAASCGDKVYFEGFLSDYASLNAGAEELNSTEIELNEKGYIEIPAFEYRLTAIKAPMGSGKTFGLKERLADGKFLLISHLRTIVFELSSRLNTLSYLDSESKGLISDSCSICLNSISSRLKPGSFDDATVVIDEAGQVRGALRQGLMNRREAYDVFRALKSLIKNAGRVVLLDAHLSADDVKFYAKLGEIEHSEIEFRIRAAKDIRRFHFDTVVSPWERRLFAAISRGDKVAIPHSTRGAAERLDGRIRQRFPDKEVRLLTRETAREGDLFKKLRDNAHTGELLNGVDVLIYSPVISSGYSIDNWSCTSVWLHVVPGGPGVFTLDQMMGRVRNVTSDEYNVYAQAGQGYNPDVGSAQEILEIVTRLDEKGIRRLPKELRRLAHSTSVANRDQEYAEHVAWCMVRTQALGASGFAISRPMESYLYALNLDHQVGRTLQDDCDEAKQEREKARRSSVNAMSKIMNDAEKIHTASGMAWEKAKRREKEARGELSTEEYHLIEHAKIVHRLGVEDVGILACKLHVGGTLRRSCSLLAALLSPEGEKQLSRRDGHERTLGTQSIDLEHIGQCLDAIRRGLEVYGIVNPFLDEPSADVDKVKDRLRELARDTEYVQALGHLLGIKFSNNVDRPFNLLDALGKRIFIEWKHIRQPTGARRRVREIDRVALARARPIVEKLCRQTWRIAPPITEPEEPK